MTGHKTDKRNAEENPIGRSLFFSCSPKNRKKTRRALLAYTVLPLVSLVSSVRGTRFYEHFSRNFPLKLYYRLNSTETFRLLPRRIPLPNRGFPDPPPTHRVPFELFRNIRHFRFSFSFFISLGSPTPIFKNVFVLSIYTRFKRPHTRVWYLIYHCVYNLVSDFL